MSLRKKNVGEKRILAAGHRLGSQRMALLVGAAAKETEQHALDLATHFRFDAASNKAR